MSKPTVQDAAIDIAASSAVACDKLAARIKHLLDSGVHEKIASLLRYYQTLMQPGQIPSRRTLDPFKLTALLPHIWMVDVVRGPTLRFRYRLIGTHVAFSFSSDATGRFLDDVHPNFEGSPLWTNLTQVVEARMPNWRRGLPEAWPTEDIASLERIYLPLSSDGENVDIVLNLTVFLQKNGREF